jgi:hypothetical protein
MGFSATDIFLRIFFNGETKGGNARFLDGMSTPEAVHPARVGLLAADVAVGHTR